MPHICGGIVQYYLIYPIYAAHKGTPMSGNIIKITRYSTGESSQACIALATLIRVRILFILLYTFLYFQNIIRIKNRL